MNTESLLKRIFEINRFPLSLNAFVLMCKSQKVQGLVSEHSIHQIRTVRVISINTLHQGHDWSIIENAHILGSWHIGMDLPWSAALSTFCQRQNQIQQTSLSCLVAPAHEGNPLTLMSWLKITVRNQELAFLAITAKPTSKSSIGDPNTVLALASLDPKSHLFRFFHRKVPQIQSWRDNTSSLSDGGATKSSCCPRKSLQ